MDDLLPVEVGWIPCEWQSGFEWLSINRPDVFRLYPNAYITCIDSTRDEATLRNLLLEIRRLGIAANLTPNGVLLNTEDFIKVIESGQVFHGFDEAWFFSEPPRLSKSSAISVTSDSQASQWTQQTKSDVSRWMLGANCFLGIGDGCGINYISRSSEFMSALFGGNIDHSRHPIN